MMRKIVAALLASLLLTPAYAQNGLPGGPGSQIPNNGGSGSGAPSGSAGGDLGGTYPNPTVATYNNGTAFGTAAAANLGTSGATLGLLNSNLTFSGANAYGTPASITLTNGTGLPISTGVSGLGTGVATALGNPAGGTGGFALVSNANVASVSNSDGTLTISPTTGAVVASLALGHANTWTANQLFPAGSATNPGAAVGITGTGLYSVSTTTLGFSVNGNSEATLTSGGVFTANAGVTTGTNFIASALAGGLLLRNGATILTSPSTGIFQFGGADSAAPSAQILEFTNVVAGTSNTAGANATIQGSLSTGSGVSGDILLRTGGTGAGATAQNAAVTALTLKGGTQVGIFAAELDAASFVPTGSTIPTNGMYLSAANTLSFSTNSAARLTLSAGGTLLNAAQTSGYSLSANAATSTIPTFSPNRSDGTTGIGAQAAGNMSAIVAGAENTRWIAAGGVQTIKGTDPATAPGAGFAKTYWVAGTSGGTCKLIAYAGTSTTPVTLVDNVGAGC